MRFVLAPFGSRGDVDPVLALGRRLVERGHEVVVCAPANFRESTLAMGLTFAPAGADFRQLFSGAQRNSQVFLESLRQAPAQFHTLLPVAEGADIIVGAALQFAAPTVAAQLGIPYRYAVFSPMYLRSRLLPAFWSGASVVPPLVHSASWALEDALQRRHAVWLNAKRSVLGMKPVKSLHMHLLGDLPVLGAFDPLLAPLPSDAVATEVTGHWRHVREEMLPDRVLAFLGAGRPPVYLGFGSIARQISTTFVASLARALINEGSRVIISRGWSELEDDLQSDKCLVVTDVPHDQLFRHVRVVVHHGGAGTTTAAAAAGVPQVVAPHLGDQFYHAARISALGLGHAADPLKRITPDKLVQLVGNLAGDQMFAVRAREFGEQLRLREGSPSAAELLERV